MKKIIFLALLIVVCFSVSANADTVFETEKIIKCEDIYNKPMVSATYDKSLSDNVYFAAGTAITDPAQILEPDMSFKFNIPKDGCYTLYVHGAFPTGGSDSFFFKFDDGEWKDVHPKAQGETLVWFTADCNRYFTKGEHEFFFHHREDGTFFDCFSIINSDGDFKIIVDGSTLESDVAPYIENGVSMIPFRALGEALGAEVSWNGEEHSATIKTPKVSLTVVENSNEAYFGKFPIKLESPARIINNRFMVPVRFVANNLQYEIQWISKTNHAFIEKR